MVQISRSHDPLELLDIWTMIMHWLLDICTMIMLMPHDSYISVYDKLNHKYLGVMVHESKSHGADIKES